MSDDSLPADPTESDIDAQVAAFAASMDAPLISDEQFDDLAAALYAADVADFDEPSRPDWATANGDVRHSYMNLAIAVAAAGWMPTSL